LIQYEDKKKEIFELKKAPKILQKRTSRMMIRSYQFGARWSHVFEFEMEDRVFDAVRKAYGWCPCIFIKIKVIQ
jgi:hypothetical protein